MNKKTPFIILLFLLSFSTIFAQKEITGRVLDAVTHKPVDAIMVTLHPSGLSNILAYTMSTVDGTFTLKFSNMLDSVTISVQAMTIKSQSKTVKSNIEFVEFLVKENVRELKEVIVKAPKIRQRGDTLDYSVSSFLNETDRSIGDVLKRLPGIQVLSWGKYYIRTKRLVNSMWKIWIC